MNTAAITTAIAFCRSAGVNSTGITASDSGRITAAPRPSTARAATSSPDECEYAQASEARPNSTSAGTSSLLAAEPVAEQPGGQQRRGQHQAVGVDEPLQVAG